MSNERLTSMMIRAPRTAAAGLWRQLVRVIVAASLALGLVTSTPGFDMTSQPPTTPISEPSGSHSVFPTVNPNHRYARALLDNAMRYLALDSGTTDVASGYPVEGWNHQPEQGLSLRSFTQLTAIGEWMEVLANVVAGHADTPYVSRERALAQLKLVVRSLRQDQQNPEASSKGLLGNFLDLGPGKRMGPLTSTVDKRAFQRSFGDQKAGAIWKALLAKGWIRPEGDDREATVIRATGYGAAFFDGALAPYADAATKEKIMALLDQRTVTVVFGDNANLTASIGNTLGALLSPAIQKDPTVRQIREELDRFLDVQKEGYTHLYNAKTGLFYFGWDAGRNRFVGWQDGAGNWQPGHMDYLVNEFRGPTAFVVMRFGLPASGLGNLGFKIKPYRRHDQKDVYVLAPWEGSAFQALGLGLSAAEQSCPSWQNLLKHAVEVEIDYARGHQLPGFLSESYTGEGARYTGDVGIPDIAVTALPRLTHVASLYTLGVAYAVAPEEIEKFLADNWSTISKLLTDHGPWEGFDTIKREPIRIQTTAHTLSLVLGLLGTAPQNMLRYLDAKGLRSRMEEIYGSGETVDLLADGRQCFAWTNDGGTVTSTRQAKVFHVKSQRARRIGIAFVSERPHGMNLSGGVLNLHYRSTESIGPAIINLKPVKNGEAGSPILSNELFLRLSQTNGQEGVTQLSLPSTPGLTAIKEVVLVCEPGKPEGSLDLAITHFGFTPYED